MNATTEAWLLEHAVRGEHVLSWVNAEHPGYAYPEAAGLLLRWCGPQPRLTPIAAALLQKVRDADVGRDGCRYTFDTGVALAGLQGFVADDEPAIEAGWDHLATWLRARDVVAPGAAPRWSTTAGPHLLKLAVGALARPAQCRGRAAVLQALQDWPVRQHPDGRLATPPHAATYLHAHAYAAEGLLASGRSFAAHRPLAEAAIRFLATVQRSDGALPAWHDGCQPQGPGRADTTAQAVRLFLLTDPRGFARHIRLGLGFLDQLSTAHGAVRYDERTDDINTWATLFALQARAWAAQGATDPTELL